MDRYFLRRFSFLAVGLICFWILPAGASLFSVAALTGIGLALVDRLLESWGAAPEDALVYLVISLFALIVWAGIAWADDVSLLRVAELRLDYPRYVRGMPFICVASLTTGATAYLLEIFAKRDKLPFDGGDGT